MRSRIGAPSGFSLEIPLFSREELFICSKLWNNKHHPGDMVADCKNTLEELGLEYVDLFLMHYPHAYQRGDEMFPADEEGTRLVGCILPTVLSEARFA